MKGARHSLGNDRSLGLRRSLSGASYVHILKKKKEKEKKQRSVAQAFNRKAH